LAPESSPLKDAQSDPEVAFWSTVFERRSVRKFKPDLVPRDVLDQLVHSGTWAPSSCNYQM
jgi:nitroreductase